MKQVKRIICLLLCAVMLTGNLPLVGHAAEIDGTCGENVTWSLSDDGVLTISGTGPMDDNPWYDDRASISSVVIENGVTTIGDAAFWLCSGLTSVKIPDSVMTICYSAFSGCERLTGVAIPDGVTTIGDSAFSGCERLTGVAIPDGVTTIGDYTFEGCERLTSVEIPNSVTTIGYGAFEDCKSLRSVKIPDSVTIIGDYAFSGCEKLTSVVIPNSVKDIGWYAFANCSKLSSVEIGDSVDSISNYAFYCCYRLASVNIPASVTSIGDYAFYECYDLNGVEIPDSVTEIGDYAFYYCENLTNLKIPDSVTDIGWSAFSDCHSLTSVEIGDSVTFIGDEAFYFCRSLSGVIFFGDAPEIEDNAFCSVTAKAYYPASNKTWNNDTKLDYGGNLTWVPHPGCVIIRQPTNVTAANGATANTTVVASGEGLKYQWYYTSNGSSSVFMKSSNATATYSTTMDSSRNGRKVYCVITDKYGNSVKSNTVTLSMKAELKITKQPANVTAANGATAKTSVVASGEGLKYQWYYTSNGSTSEFYKSSTTTATYSTTMDSSRDGRKVYCVVTDKYGNSVKSETVTLKMK